MAGTGSRRVATACAEWLAVACLVVGAVVVLTAEPAPAGSPSGPTDRAPADDLGEASAPAGVPVWARNGFVPGARGVLLGPVRGPLLLSDLTVTATAPGGVTDPVELYVELAPGGTTAGCLAAQTEPATTRVAALAGTRTDPTHALATWPVPQRLDDRAGGSWCSVVEVRRSGTRGPGGDAAVTAIVSVGASDPRGTAEVALPPPSTALLRVPAGPARHRRAGVGPVSATGGARTGARVGVMRIEKIGHSCLVVQTGDAHLLIDPGTLAAGWESITGLTGILLTHQHADHYDADRFGALVEANPDAVIVADEGTAPLLAARGMTVTTVRDGDSVEVGVTVGVRGRVHEVIHPDIPVVPNVGYLVGELFHPGDAFTLPPEGIRVLAAPLVAPWSKIADTVDYLRAADVPIVLPVHDAVTSVPGMYRAIAAGLLPDSTTIRPLDGEGPVTF